ncbi:uncharacterized protein KIAA2026 [Phycodurus eques]|uniref:uncharacterized protein KIAA2026 n=1 Tax=Phycodurus eques TaxID=693459 RepID=UPI002ACE6DE0|nr:uncharacterized protein KIAA2026 [Phycodurus eques]XP_061554396.1 uncharacterized protein KIAA2026 [Phycodurus eques]XP_061554397.1 uncharacterized protein KIAA2026 [Phycodurus eques]
MSGILSSGSGTGTDDMDLDTSEDVLNNGASVAPVEHLPTSNEGMSDFSNSDISLPEVCITTNFEESMSHEVQQAYRIFSSFLLDKHKAVASLFLHAVGHQEAQCGVGGICAPGQARLKQSMCLQRMEEKFVGQEYQSITEFVADFRLMLENCYRYHGVDHWLSKQAQKLEIMLEQKLTLLSRTLREKTTLAVTSKGRFGAEDERAQGGTSTRRRLSSRNLATITVGGHESVMVQALRMEEQQRAKEEKKQRELEKKEAEEMSAKAVEEWEQTLLSQASPQTIDTLWELPAIGHFLCLAQTVLNLPEIVFFELERCLLMPRCSSLLSKIMSSLLSPWQRRATLHRRPALPYRRWEAELRLCVKGWYRSVGGARNQPARAQQLGLCHHFFLNLGEASPLEEKPFHSLRFHQRVWLLKGLCDHVYETQKDVQDAVLAQPIHECRESILGYDSKDNAYIHFPHFCGADLRIYCQSPSTPPAFPFPSALVRQVEKHTEDFDVLKDEEGYPGSATQVGDTSGDLGKTLEYFTRENGDGQEQHEERFWPMMKEEERCESGSSDVNSSDELSRKCRTSSFVSRGCGKQETADIDYQCTTIEEDLSLCSGHPIKVETHDPCLNVGEHTYTGRSPARSADNTYSTSKLLGIKMEGVTLNTGHHQIAPCLECGRAVKSVRRGCSCPSTHCAQNSSDEDEVTGRMWFKKNNCKKKRGTKRGSIQAAESSLQGITATIQRKYKRKKHQEGRKKVQAAKKIEDEPSVEPSFKLICTSLQELRELISKTEDELDDLESTKKKLDRWYLSKEAVKDLHSTLIRLLNELSPWEPKLVRAYHRNRLRLKKEFDDFKRHPEYNNFVREECMSSSSSDEDEDMSLFFCQQGSEDELEHVVPRGLWTRASSGDIEAESSGERSPTFVITNHQKHPETDEQVSIVQADSGNTTFVQNNGPKSKCEMIKSNTDGAAGKPVHYSSTSKFCVAHPTSGLPKGYTPIPTLLAKSVGNKVTLMKRPVDYSGFHNTDRQSKGCSSSVPTSTAGNAKPQPQTPQSTSLQNSLQTQGKCAIRQTGMVKVAAAPLTTDWAKQNQTLLQNPLQLGTNVPERHNSAKMSVQPGQDYYRQEKVMQQVVILPSKHVIHKSEEQQSKALMHLSTSVAGFCIPDNVPQVALLKDAPTVKIPSLSSPPCQQHRTESTPGFQVTQHSQSSTSQTIHQNPSSIISTTTFASTMPPKLPDHKQELKTICIRDSQSILVTTRGGNTGIVKVQTSSAQNAVDGLSSSPIITISPQFKAFLVSKSAEASSLSFKKNPCPTATVASVSIAQPQKQIPSVLKSSATTSPTDLRNFTLGTPVASVPGSHKSDGSTVTRNIYNPAQTLAKRSLVVNSTVDGNARAEVVGQPGLKRPSTEEQHKVTKFILVTPSSCASTVAIPKDTSSTNLPLGSRVMVINETSATTSCASAGSVPKQAMTSAVNGQQLTTSLSSPSLKMGLSPGVDSNVLSKGKNISLPTGLQIQLSGMTTTIGQTIGALSRCTSTSTPVSVSETRHSPATTTQLAPFTKSNTVTSCLSQLVANATLSRTSQPHSFTIASQLGSFISTTATHPAGSLPTGVLTSRPRVTSSAQGNPNPSSVATLAHQSSHVLAKETTPMTSPFQNALNKTQSHIFSATTNSTQCMSPATGANNSQQRIVINTSKHLVAGTQIFLNNTCFVVPPQGLGPGSHVLIISNPSPQKVPNVSASTIGTAAPLQGLSQGSIIPQGPILPKSQAGLPGVPLVNSPFAVCSPAVGPTNVQGSSLLPPNVSLVSTPSSQVCDSVLNTPPQLAKQAAHISSVVTGGLSLGSALMPPRAECSTTISPLNASVLPRLPAPLSSLPSLIATRHSLPEVLATTRDSCIQPPATSRVTVSSITHLGLGITSVSKQAPSVIHEVFAGSSAPRIQNLPTSTVTPIESTADALETSCAVTLSPPPATFQPITLLTTNPIHQSIALTNQALVKISLQKSPLGMANSVANKLLISPDGAILSSVQCQAKAAEPNMYPKKTALILTPNTSSRTWRHQPTPSQPNN